CGLNGKSDPILDHKIGESFLDDRRYVLERRHALGTSHSQRAQFARIDEIDHRQHGDEHVVVGAVEQIGDGLRELLIGNVRGAHSRLELKHFTDQMRRVPKPPEENVNWSGLLFRSETSSETEFAGTEGFTTRTL